MTVREAFAKAGHPVPEGVKEIRSNGGGHMVAFTARAVILWESTGWEHESEWCVAEWHHHQGWRNATSVYLSQDARDYYDALPECVRMVLDQAKAEKDARIAFLEKALEQAVQLANIRVELRPKAGDEEGEGTEYVYCDSCGTPFMSTLAAYLREREGKG